MKEILDLLDRCDQLKVRPTHWEMSADVDFFVSGDIIHRFQPGEVSQLLGFEVARMDNMTGPKNIITLKAGSETIGHLALSFGVSL